MSTKKIDARDCPEHHACDCVQAALAAERAAHAATKAENIRLHGEADAAHLTAELAVEQRVAARKELEATKAELAVSEPERVAYQQLLMAILVEVGGDTFDEAVDMVKRLKQQRDTAEAARAADKARWKRHTALYAKRMVERREQVRKFERMIRDSDHRAFVAEAARARAVELLKEARPFVYAPMAPDPGEGEVSHATGCSCDECRDWRVDRIKIVKLGERIDAFLTANAAEEKA